MPDVTHDRLSNSHIFNSDMHNRTSNWHLSDTSTHGVGSHYHLRDSKSWTGPPLDRRK